MVSGSIVSYFGHEINSLRYFVPKFHMTILGTKIVNFHISCLSFGDRPPETPKNQGFCRDCPSRTPRLFK